MIAVSILDPLGRTVADAYVKDDLILRLAAGQSITLALASTDNEMFMYRVNLTPAVE